MHHFLEGGGLHILSWEKPLHSPFFSSLGEDYDPMPSNSPPPPLDPLVIHTKYNHDCEFFLVTVSRHSTFFWCFYIITKPKTRITCNAEERVIQALGLDEKKSIKHEFDSPWKSSLVVYPSHKIDNLLLVWRHCASNCCSGRSR